MVKETEIFWESYKLSFNKPIKSELPGFDIHVVPRRQGQDIRFTLDESKAIAYGTILWEAQVQQLLLIPNRDQKSVQRNAVSLESSNYKEIANVKRKFEAISNEQQLAKLMHGSGLNHEVLWDFMNIGPKESRQPTSETGKIMFRGGRRLKGEERTERWVAFVITFVDLCLANASHNLVPDGNISSFA